MAQMAPLPSVKPPSPHSARSPNPRLIAQAYIFFCALSVHAVFDGLSLGSELDTAGFVGTLVAVVSFYLP